MIDGEQLKKIKNFAMDLDWNKAFGGKSYGNMHLPRTVQNAHKILSSGEIDADRNIVEAGAWLHDSGLAEDIYGDALCNSPQVAEFLHQIKVSQKDQEQILECIRSHDGQLKANTNEAKVVNDADTLEKLGPLGILRETWKRSQMGWNTEKIIKHLPGHLEKRKSQLHTQKAKAMAKELDEPSQRFFKSLEEQLMMTPGHETSISAVKDDS